MPNRPIRLHGHPRSGHSHRVEPMLSLLGRPVERIDVDLMQGEPERSAFLALDPLGRVPVSEDEPLVLADSDAILVYLARRYGAKHAHPETPAEAAAGLARSL